MTGVQTCALPIYRARVTLLHVLAPHEGTDVYYVTGGPESGAHANYDAIPEGHLGGPRPSPPTVVRRDLDEEALTRLHDLVPDAFRATWQVEVATGHPADTIVRIAQARGADLIVMGTHGRTGLQHVLLGSVAERVVRLASCPVLTVRLTGKASEA